MIEKKVPFTLGDGKTIERLLEDDNVGINHMILPQGESLPIHDSNSNVYMTIVRGSITLKLNEQEPHTYEKGNIVVIPFRTRMHVYNENEPVAEIFVIKAPSPRHMQG